MIATTHLAVGAAVGLWSAGLVSGLVAAKPPFVQSAVQAGVAFAFATGSHLVLDAIPHNEGLYNTSFGKWPVLVLELVIIFNVIFWLCYVRELDFPIVFFGMAGGAWLDFTHLMQEFGLMNNYMFNSILSFHNHVHAHSVPDPIPSLPIQILVAIIALMLLF